MTTVLHLEPREGLSIGCVEIVLCNDPRAIVRSDRVGRLLNVVDL